MKDLSAMIVAILLMVVAILVLMPLSALYYAWALSLLWTWFMVPLGLPAIGIANAYGLMLVINMFKAVEAPVKGEKEWGTFWGNWLLKPVVAVGIGWLVKTLFL